MSSSKKMTCKGTLLQVFICLRTRTTYPSPPPLTHCISVYSIQIYTGKEGRGGETLTREKVRGAIVHKAGSKIPT